MSNKFSGSKVLMFGIMGAIGCFITAIFGELLLALFMPSSATPPPQQQVDVMFVLDVTGSMRGEIDGIKNGIKNFSNEITSRNLDVRIGLIAYRDDFIGQHPTILMFDGQPFTKDSAIFSKEVGKLKALGGGDEEESTLDALALAVKQPFRVGANKVIVLITDAPPKIPDVEIKSIEKGIELLKEKNINQLHLVVQESDLSYFRELQNGAPGEVFKLSEAASGREGFDRILPVVGKQIAESIKGLQSKEEYSKESFLQLLIVICIWTAILSVGIALALIIGQNYYLRRKYLSFGEGVKGGIGSLMAGLVAGISGQILFYIATSIHLWDGISRILGWTILGALVGRFIALFVPNLDGKRSATGGALGGGIGAIGFLISSAILGEGIGRLVGASILGFFIGLMVAIVEATSRKAWLEIFYGPKEKRIVSLGAEPVTIGSADSCTIYAQNVPPVAFRYKFDGSNIICEDVASNSKNNVTSGEEKIIGNLKVFAYNVEEQLSQPTTKEAIDGVSRIIQLSTGKNIDIKDGVKIMQTDIPGLSANSSSGIVAEITSDPNSSTVMRITNLSTQTWSVTLPNGEIRQVAPGQNMKLAEGRKINFGTITGEVK